MQLLDSVESAFMDLALDSAVSQGPVPAVSHSKSSLRWVFSFPQSTKSRVCVPSVVACAAPASGLGDIMAMVTPEIGLSPISWAAEKQIQCHQRTENLQHERRRKKEKVLRL